MKMKPVKWLTAAVTVIALSIICAVCAGASTIYKSPDGNFEYTVEADGNITIGSYIGQGGAITVPSAIGGRKVTKLANTFNGSAVTSVTIPDGITELGDYVFSSCGDLVSVKLPSTITALPNSAFAYCKKLTSVDIPSSVTSIGEKAFYSCTALKEVKMPSKLTSLGNYAFCNCNSLESISIPTGLTTIDKNTFSSCTKLREVTLPDTVTTVGEKAFLQCINLKSVKLPSDLTTISDAAFYFCPALVDITIPTKVTYIGELAFGCCTELSQINIPASAKFVGEDAFYRCRGVRSITVAPTNTAVCVENGALYTKAMDKLLLYPSKSTATSFKISEKTYYITPYAFYNAENLKSVALPSKLYSAGAGAFYGCTALKTITVPDTLKEIGKKAFGFYHIINVTADQYIDGFVLRGQKNSLAEEYANENEVTFKALNLSENIALKSKNISSTSVTLNWNEITNADGYTVEIYKDKKWTTAANITSYKTTEYKVGGLNPITAYKFRIQAYAANMKGKYSSELSLYTNPYGVGGFKCSAKTSTSVTLQWNKGTTASGYQLQQYKNGKWTDIFTPSSAADTSYTVKGLTAGTAGYKFRIRAYKTFGNTKQYGSWSSEVKVNTNPYGVGGFKCSAKTSTSVTLQWNKGTTASGYQLQQYKNGKWTDIFTPSSAADTSYTVKGLTAGTAGYKFRIRAYKTFGNTKQYGSWSSEVKVNTNPYGVGGFKVKSISSTSVTLQWNKGTTASGYELQQYKNGKWTAISTPNKASTVSYTVKGLKSNTSFSFRIRAYKTYGNTRQYGSWSKTLTVKTSK